MPIAELGEETPKRLHAGNGRHATLVVWALILAGGILRIGFFWLDTRFWGDEAALALNLKTRTVSQFLAPLDHEQHAPLLYILLEKGVFDMLGSGEYALRLPSLVASLLSLPLFFWWMRRTAPTNVSLVALIFFALNPRLISYSAQLKPYAFDVLSTLVICVCGLGLRQHAYEWKWLALFALVGGSLIWVSFPVAFVLAGAALALMVTEGTRGRRRNGALVLLPVLVWGISFLYNQVLITHHSLADQELLFFWQDQGAFAPFPPKNAGQFRDMIALFLRPFQWATPFKVLIGVPALLWLAGLIRLFRKDATTAGFCLVPVVLTFVASGLHLYPFEGRLILFLVPLYLTLVAWGIACFQLDAEDRVTAPVLIAFLLIAYVVLLNDICHDHFNRTSVPRALNRIAKSHQPHDALYVFYSGGYRTFLWYGHSYSLDDMAIIHGSPRTHGKRIVETDLERMTKARRLWLLFPESSEADMKERDEILKALDMLGNRLDEFHNRNTDAFTDVFLYEIRPATKEVGQLQDEARWLAANTHLLK